MNKFDLNDKTENTKRKWEIKDYFGYFHFEIQRILLTFDY
ncbi:MAG: hypothetical protein HW421_3803 [Ignavibacteria bacterium]|nr:hypothetical protein [Ignavibacteria bacterium]